MLSIGITETAVKEMHSYTTPAISVIPIESMDKDYFAWLLAETGHVEKTED